jgi:hypothetical protein
VDWFEILILKMGLIIRGTSNQLVNRRKLQVWVKDAYFLNGAVTGSEWLKFGFMTSGFNRIWGPSLDRGGNALMIGGGPVNRIGGCGGAIVVGSGGGGVCTGG